MVTRVNGFTSGMDIDSTVKQLMQARRAPLDKILQKKQSLQWQQDDLRSMNTKFLDFKNQAFNMKLQGAYLTKKTASADESIVTAIATPSATNGIYKLRVTGLAEAASATSGVVGTSTTTLADKIETLITDPASNVPAQTLFTISGEKGSATIEVNKADTVSSFISNVNSKSSSTGVKLNFDETLKRFFFVSSTTGLASKVELNSTSDDFMKDVLKIVPTTVSLSGATVAGAVFKTNKPDVDKVIDNTLTADQSLRISYEEKDYNFTVGSGTKIGDLLNSINNDSSFKSTGIKAGLDPTTGALTFQMPDSSKIISFSDQTADGSDIISKLGLPATSSGDTIKGATFMSLFVDTSKMINSNITTDQTFRIKYNNKDYDFKVSSNTSINALVQQINGSDLGKAGVSARIDSTTGELKFTSPDSNNKFKFSDTPVDLLAALGLPSTETSGTPLSYSQFKDNGTNAKINYNGVIGAEFASNTFSINGVSFTAKKVSTDDVNVTVSQDVDAAYNSIKTFVDKYNELLGAVNSKTNEEYYRKYQPLTDEQKTAMKDKEIELWEEKAKSGLLRNNSILTGAADSFRASWYESVSGLSASDFKQLSDVGITTLDYSEKGKLYINESKLKEALSKDPDQVMALFTANDNNSSTSAGDGVAVRLYDAADRALTQLKEKAGTSISVSSSFEIGKQMTQLNKQISTWQTRLKAYEEQYYKQFTAMEQAMNKYNSQSSYLTQLSR